MKDQSDQSLTIQKGSESQQITQQSNNTLGQSNQEQVINSQDSKQNVLSVLKGKKQPSFSNFVIQKYESMSERDFKKVPISYLKQIYQRHSIDLKKLHTDATQIKQEQVESNMMIYSNLNPQKSQANYLSKTQYMQNKNISSLPSSPQSQTFSLSNSFQNGFPMNRMNQTTDMNQFDQIRKGFFSNQTSQSNSPLNSFQNDSSITSRSMSSNNNFNINSGIDVIKEDNSAIQSPYLPKQNDNIFSANQSPPPSDNSDKSWKMKNQQLAFGNQFGKSSPQSNRVLKKNNYSDQHVSLNNKQFGIKTLQQKLYQPSQNTLPNIPKKLIVKVDIRQDELEQPKQKLSINNIMNSQINFSQNQSQIKKQFNDIQHQIQKTQIESNDLQPSITGVQKAIIKTPSKSNKSAHALQMNQIYQPTSSKNEQSEQETIGLTNSKNSQVQKQQISEDIFKNSPQKQYYFANEHKKMSYQTQSNVVSDITRNQASKASTIVKSSMTESQKFHYSTTKAKTQVDEDYFSQEKDGLHDLQISSYQPQNNQQMQTIKNNSQGSNKLEEHEIKLMKKQSSVIENFQKLSLTSNSFLFRVDEEKEKLKNEHLRSQLQKKSQTQIHFIRKSFRLTEINQGSPTGVIIEDNKYGEYETPLQLKNSKSSNQLTNTELNQNNEDQIDSDSQQKEVKIMESKFVLHKPHNHTKNKAYIKNLQTSKNAGESSPIQPPKTPNKKKLSYISNSPQSKDKKKSHDFSIGVSPPTGINSPLTLSKAKSQFSKIQGSFPKLDNEDLEAKSPFKGIGINIFKSQEMEMTTSQKNRLDSHEIKTTFVKQILEEQTNMFHEYLVSLENKVFEKKRQENQINLKTASNQNDGLSPRNNQLSLLQDLLQVPPSKRASQLANKSNDLSPSVSRSRRDSVSSLMAKSIDKGCQSPIVSKLKMEQPLMIRRSSMRNSSLNQQINFTNANEEDRGNRSPLHIEGLSDLLRGNETKHRSQFSNTQQSMIPGSPSSKSNAIPQLSIEMQSKNPIFDQSPINSQKRNSRIYNDGNSPLNQLNDILQNNMNFQTNGQHNNRQASMFSKMQSPQLQLSRKSSKVVIIDSDTSLQKNQKNNSLRRESSNLSSDSSDSDSKEQSKNNSYTSFDKKTKVQQLTLNLVPLSNQQLSRSEFNQKKDDFSPQKNNKTPSSDRNSPQSNQNFGFSDSVRNFYDKQNEEEKQSLSSIKDNNNNRSSFHMAIIQSQLNQGNQGSNGRSPRQSSITKIQNQDMQPRQSKSYSRFQSFESRGSIHSPKNQTNSRIRPQISASEQPSKQKGLATIYIELNEIMNPSILKNVSESEKLQTLLRQNNCKMDTLKQFYATFLQFVLIEDSKVFNPDTFASFKIHYSVFEQLQIILIDTLKSLNYNTHAIEQIIERLEYQKKYITEGLLVNEIGGASGILKTIVESYEELDTKLPHNFSNLNPEEKTSVLTRVITIICNQERLYNPNASSYINTIDQKSTFSIEMQPYLHYFKDFGQMEFYCLKLSFYTSLKQRGYRKETIFRFLEQFEKARYKISSTLTMNNLLQDKQLYDQLIQDFVWKIQHDNSLCAAFENNDEAIIQFSNSVVLEFIYSLQGRFDLFFLLSKLPHFKDIHIHKLSLKLSAIVENRGLSLHIQNDIKIKFLKLSYKLGLTKSPITQCDRTNFLDDLIQEINSIMHSDECFENFLRKFPEDKLSLTFGDNSQRQSGLRALSFFLLTVLSDYDVYSIQDLQSSLQAFNVSITIPIQWKIALELALNNLKVSQNIIKEWIDIISVQFSLLYKNTQYESFNEVLLN